MLDKCIERCQETSKALVIGSLATLASAFLKSPDERYHQALVQLEQLQKQLESRATDLFPKLETPPVLDIARLSLATHWARAGKPSSLIYPSGGQAIWDVTEADRAGELWQSVEEQSIWGKYLDSTQFDDPQLVADRCPAPVPKAEEMTVSAAIRAYEAGTRTIKVAEFHALASALEDSLKDCTAAAEPIVRSAFWLGGLDCNGPTGQLQLVLNEEGRSDSGSCATVTTVPVKLKEVAWLPEELGARQRELQLAATSFRSAVIEADSDLLDVS